MRLHYFPGQGAVKNFGDELNRWLWSRIAPELLERSSETLFVAIGTLLNDALPAGVPKVIFGAGVGYGNAVPRVDDTWRLYFVRGPLSAEALGLDRAHAITDPAILLRLAFDPHEIAGGDYVAFVPHWENAHDGWRPICEAAGVRYVDPTWMPERVLAELASCRLVLAEAMHAAIVADAMRIPWVPIQSGTHVLRFKWQDWCAAMSLDYCPRRWLTNWAPAVSVRGGGPKRWLKNRLLVAQMRMAVRSGGMLSQDAIFAERLDACTALLDKLRREAPEFDR